MAATNNKLIILALLICLLPHIVFSSASAKDNDTKAYLESWCQTTRYQDRCVRSLSPYVSLRANQSQEDPVRFALQASLTLLKEALSQLEALSRVAGNPLLHNSLAVLKNLLIKVTEILSQLASGGDGVGGKYINLQRRTSTALTEAETLVSKFQGRRLSKLEATIYGKVKNVEETTKNALAIVQHYAATRH